MRVDITAAINEYFKYDILCIPGFKHDAKKVSGFVKTDSFLDDSDKCFDFVSDHEAEFTKDMLKLYPVFNDIMKMFYLPAPVRVLADGKRAAAFIYGELTFIVGPTKLVDKDSVV